MKMLHGDILRDESSEKAGNVENKAEGERENLNKRDKANKELLKSIARQVFDNCLVSLCRTKLEMLT